MPRLKMLLNLGTRDAARFSLDIEKAKAGDVVSVNDEAAAEMLTHGWATDKLDEDHPAAMAAPHGSSGLSSGPTEAERHGAPTPTPASATGFSGSPAGEKKPK